MALDFQTSRPYVLFMGDKMNTKAPSVLSQIRARKERARLDSAIIAKDGTKVVNGVKLYPTYNNEGNLTYVSIPE